MDSFFVSDSPAVICFADCTPRHRQFGEPCTDDTSIIYIHLEAHAEDIWGREIAKYWKARLKTV